MRNSYLSLLSINVLGRDWPQLGNPHLGSFIWWLSDRAGTGVILGAFSLTCLVVNAG